MSMDVIQERTIVSKVTRRLIPLLFACYIVAYIDRLNIAFAGLQLQQALGVDTGSYNRILGIGKGIFFIGYLLFEVPSNLILQRVGARLWIARIMILWGLIASAMMFIAGDTSFYVMRFLLGVSEAGFFPGIILYLTYWYPAKERAQTMAMFATAAVMAGIIGSPIAGALMKLKGFGGLDGRQWLFLLEGIPAVLLGFVVFFWLPDKPAQARWLSAEEKAGLEAKLNEEAALAKLQNPHRLIDAFTSRRVWLLCLLYFLLNVGGYGYELWLPTIIKGFSGQSDFVVGLINAIPYVAAIVIMVPVGRHSDRTGERRWHVALGAMTSAAGFALSAWFQNPYLAMAALTLAFVGIKSMMGPFWAMGTAVLSGTAAAGGIALINSVGNIGGFVGPTIVGSVVDKTGSPSIALLVLGGALLAMGLIATTIRTGTGKEKAPQ
jgi:ACS family tartrate transporter-like MFS transporter